MCADFKCYVLSLVYLRCSEIWNISLNLLELTTFLRISFNLRSYISSWSYQCSNVKRKLCLHNRINWKSSLCDSNCGSRNCSGLKCWLPSSLMTGVSTKHPCCIWLLGGVPWSLDGGHWAGAIPWITDAPLTLPNDFQYAVQVKQINDSTLP